MMHLQQSVMKRGIIHLYKIDILFLDKEFEHDIYELIRAFYPESEITSSYEEKGADCDLSGSKSRMIPV